MTTHKRGGAYTLRLMEDITNWNGNLLDRSILDHIQMGDNVRVIFEPYGLPRYITITDVLSNGYFKGYVNDPYEIRHCDICKKEAIKGRLYHCTNWKCEYDCHMECLHNNPDKKCNCDKKEFPLMKWSSYLLNGSIIVFKKNNISEIPNWSKNTTKYIECYKQSRGYRITGTR